jgi:aspartate oxidase
MLLPGEDVAPFSMLATEDTAPGGLARPLSNRIPEEKEVRGLMWNSVGLWRERALLETAIEALDEWYAALGSNRSRVAALVTVGRLMARAALRREETRGSHARADFPSRDDVKFRIHLGEMIP